MNKTRVIYERGFAESKIMWINEEYAKVFSSTKNGYIGIVRVYRTKTGKKLIKIKL